MTRYRSTINFSRCQRNEVRDFPDDSRTAGLVSRGILVPVDGAAPVFGLPALEALTVPDADWFTDTPPPLLRPVAPVEPPAPADKVAEFVVKDPLPIPERPKATTRKRRTAADAVTPRA